MQSLVSIIIPAFNNAETLQETLASVLKQDYSNWECLIVDDRSTDLTKQVAETVIGQTDKIHLLDRPEDKLKGANACRNYGFQKSKGVYVMFLDADDVLSKNCIASRVEAFKMSEDTDAVVADTALWIDGEFKTKSINKDTDNQNAEAYLKQFLSYNLPWTIMSVLWRREFIRDILFDENLLRFQDVDFHINALMQNCKIIRLKQIDNYYRVDPNKIHNKQHILSVLNNLFLLFNKHITVIISHVEYRLAFQKFVNYFLQYYIFPNYHTYKAEVSLLLNVIYASDLYSKKQIKLIKTQAFLVRTKLNRTKYIGMYSLSNYIKKELENS